MSINNVCRLCLATDNLLWIFNDIDENMKIKDIVYFATGIEIHIKDVISQHICEKCYQFTVKMFQFRSQCVKNEKYLKDQWKKYIKNKKCNIPNTQVTIKNELKQISDNPSKPSYCIHPSVTEIAKTYPDIKLPVLCLKSHVAPVVVMKMDEVESYFKNKNLDINVYIKSALMANRRNNRLIKLKELNANTKQEALVGAQQLKNNSVIVSNEGTRVANRKKTVKSSSIKRFGMNALIRTPQRFNNSVVKSKEHARVAKMNRFIETNCVKQCPKENVNTNENKECSAKFPLAKGQQTISLSKFNRKRKLSYITTKRNTKRSRLLDTASKSTEYSLNVIDLTKSLSEVQDTTDTTKLLYLTPKGPTQSLSKNKCSESLSYIDKSVPLHICNICNSVQYSSKHLRKHRMDHLRCQFCKERFRTLPKKIRHIENLCIIKKAMTNMPDIEVEKIEYDIETRRKYPEAFVNFPPFETENGIDLTSCDNVKLLKLDITQKFKTILTNMSNSSRSNIALSEQTVKDINNVPAHLLDVIEILSDEEESSDASSRNQMKESISIKSSTKQLSTCQSKEQSYQLFSPKINIENHCLLNNIYLMDSDIEIMKKFLTFSQSIHTFTQRQTQTFLPTNKDIIAFEKNVILKDLKQQLYMYKVPVISRFGQLRVSYDYNTSSKPHSKLCFWNDLTPVDIKQTKDQSNPIVSDETSDSLDQITLHTNSNSLTSLGANENCTGPTMNNDLQSQGDAKTLSVEQTKALTLPDLFSENTRLDNETGIPTNEETQVNNIELIYL